MSGAITWLEKNTFLLIGASIATVVPLLYLNLFREAVIFWVIICLLVLILKRNLEWVIYLLVINIFLFPTGGDFKESRLFDLFGFPVTSEKGLIIISGFLFLANYVKNANFSLQRNYRFQTIKRLLRENLVLLFMGLFIITALFSMSLSPFPLDKFRFPLIALGFALFLVVSKGLKKKEINQILFLLTIGIVTISLYALIEFALRANLFEGSEGFRPFITGEIYRVKSTQGLPLVMSSLINMLFPLVLVVAAQSKKEFIRFFLVAGLFILPTAQLTTFTRTGWLVFLLEVPLVVVFFKKEITYLIKDTFRGYPKGIIKGGLIIFPLLIFIYGTQLLTYVTYRLPVNLPFVSTAGKTLNVGAAQGYESANAVSTESRLEGLELSRRVLIHRPLFGVGLGGFGGAVKAYGQDLKALKSFSAADNSYTMLVTETGILGTVTFLLILGAILLKSISLAFSAKDPLLRKLSSAVFISGLVVIVQSLGFEIFSYAHTVFIFFILAGLIFYIQELHEQPLKNYIEK